MARRVARRLTEAAEVWPRPGLWRQLAVAVQHAWTGGLTGPPAPGELLLRLVRSAPAVGSARRPSSEVDHQTAAPLHHRNPPTGEDGLTTGPDGPKEPMAAAGSPTLTEAGNPSFRAASSEELPQHRGGGIAGTGGPRRFLGRGHDEAGMRWLEPLLAPEPALAGRPVDTGPLVGEVGPTRIFDPPLGQGQGSTAPVVEPAAGRWSPSGPLRGAQAQASGEDLAALAARLQLILEEEARRHGIDV